MPNTAEKRISPYQDRRLRQKTMNYVVIEGMLSVVAIGLQQTFYIPCLNAMGATKLQIGIAAGIPALSMGIIQLLVPLLLRSVQSYKKIVLASIFFHALSFLPFAVIVYFNCDNAVWFSIAAVAINASALGFGAAAWTDWMSYIIPRRRRGVFFGNRNRILTAIQLIVSLIAGRMLDIYQAKILLVFTLIWISCFLARMSGSIILALQYEPVKLKNRPDEELPSFKNFLKQIYSNPFGKFVLAFSTLNFAANFSGPFFAIYMLNDLQLTYLKYSILIITPSLTIILTMKFWGKFCDKIGYVIPMRFFMTIILGAPLVWIVTRNYWILIILQVVAGMAWGAMNMASFNFTLDAVGKSNRLNSISYLNAISSLCIFAGATLGGIIGPLLPQFTSSQLHSVFLFSVLLRIVPMFLFQSIPIDKPKNVKMRALERFFFDPRLSLRIGFDRLIFGRNKRNF